MVGGGRYFATHAQCAPPCTRPTSSYQRGRRRQAAGKRRARAHASSAHAKGTETAVIQSSWARRCDLYIAKGTVLLVGDSDELYAQRLCDRAARVK